jgi:Protein of unknown function (DUF3800)
MIPRVSWLLFLDESGHDHKNCPYEVRGGVAIHASMLWLLVQELQAAELSAFGANLREYRTEIKGSKLLDKDRFKWAKQGNRMPDEARRKHARGFLTKGLEHLPPTRQEFTAFGQASLEMARSVFDALRRFDTCLFATIVPRTIIKPTAFEAEEYLRKDHVFLLERYFYFLESKHAHGLLVPRRGKQRRRSAIRVPDGALFHENTDGTPSDGLDRARTDVRGLGYDDGCAGSRSSSLLH